MTEILTIFKEYSGAGYLVLLYLLSLIYLWIQEEDSTVRSILIYGSGVLQLLFFIPLFFYGYEMLDSGTYYRILWLLPMTVLTAYCGVRLAARFPKVGLGAVVVLIVLGGNYVYSNQYITKAENLYHIPQEIIDVCDMILPEEGEERIFAVFPDEFIHYVRQYSGEIQMPYGREMLVEAWEMTWAGARHPLFLLMNEEVIDARELEEMCTEYGCHYLVLEKIQELEGTLDQDTIQLIGETKNYLVYRNENVDFAPPVH